MCIVSVQTAAIFLVHLMFDIMDEGKVAWEHIVCLDPWYSLPQGNPSTIRKSVVYV